MACTNKIGNNILNMKLSFLPEAPEEKNTVIKNCPRPMALFAVKKINFLKNNIYV